ncbi:MAG: histidine--tRNA ligase [Candidatus Omnitrophica bacterium]|nr:histidine--tRNA ligase [Candidatus Omnitrophota bacterium]
MTVRYSVPRGTSDILPGQIAIWQEIDKQARAILSRFNYREIRTPIFEETGLFKRSLGQTSDIVNKQLLELASNKEEGYSLRPEGTAPIVRAYLENSLDKQESLSKLFYIGPMFRGERPQKGRLRQFNQIGVEVIGLNADSLYIDCEVIILSMSLLKAFGVQGSKLLINTLGSENDKVKLAGYLRDKLKGRAPELCEDCQNRFERNVFRILDCKERSCINIVAGINFDNSYLSEESRIRFESIKDILQKNKIEFIEAPRLVRGLDYYTETVFEITNPNLGSQDAVGAGGRYNNLPEVIGGESKKDIRGIGFSLGIERIILAIDEELKKVEEKLDIFLAVLGKGEIVEQGFAILNSLRRAGFSADMGYQESSLKSQMRFANKCNARLVVMIGEDEVRKKAVLLKDMVKSEQEEILFSEDNLDVLINKARERLKVLC